MQGFDCDRRAMCEVGFTVTEKGRDCLVMAPPTGQAGRCTVVALDGGVFLLFNEVRSGEWPAPAATLGQQMLLLNYCVSGRCDMNLDSGVHFFMEPAHLAFGMQRIACACRYPTRSYDGLELMIDLGTCQRCNPDFLAAFGIQPLKLRDYCRGAKPFAREVDGSLKTALDQLWQTRHGSDRVGQKLGVANVLHELSLQVGKRDSHTHYFTSSQVAVAQQAAQLIEQHLARRLTVAELSRLLGVCESSVKEYFKGVMGESISGYAHRRRMEEAARLLVASPQRKVADIALAVGYENQGKFAASFRAFSGAAPLEYRRGKAVARMQAK